MAKNTVIKHGDKEYEYFRITRTIGHKYVNGKKVPIKKQFVGTSKKDAERKYQNFLLGKKEEEMSKTRTDESVSDLMKFYVENILSVNSKYSIGTRELYIGAYKTHLAHSQISSIAMSSLTSADIQKLYNSLQISKSAMDTVHKFMKGFIDWCKGNGYCEDLLNAVIIPEKVVVHKQTEIVTWTDEEIENIKRAEPEYALKPMLLFALYTGMRISELIGLKFEDIHGDVINIKRQYYRGSWTAPKGNKTRSIPLHPMLKEELTNINRDGELVFHTSTGNPLDYHNVIRSIDRFYQRNGIPHKKFHAYRATFVTNLCKNGVPIQVASKLAGHESIEITSRYYTNVELDEMAEAICKI